MADAATLAKILEDLNTITEVENQNLSMYARLAHRNGNIVTQLCTLIGNRLSELLHRIMNRESTALGGVEVIQFELKLMVEKALQEALTYKLISSWQSPRITPFVREDTLCLSIFAETILSTMVKYTYQETVYVPSGYWHATASGMFVPDGTYK